MLRITVLRTSITPTNILVQISIVASSDSAGIFNFTVIARDGTNATGPISAGCARNVFPEVITIARDRLPVFVNASECDPASPNNPGRTLSKGPLFGEDRPEGQMQVICPTMGASQEDFAPLTNNQACIDSQNRLQRLRNEILTMCGEASATRGRRNSSAAAAGVFFTLAAALAVAGATISGHPVVAVVLFIVSAVALIVGASFSLGAGLQQNVLASQSAAIADARRRYADGVANLEQVCCREFITISPDVPECP